MKNEMSGVNNRQPLEGTCTYRTVVGKLHTKIVLARFGHKRVNNDDNSSITIYYSVLGTC